MRLTAILYHVKNKRPHGHVYRGKHRKVKPPTFEDLTKLRHDFEREERNMLILRHPYLTLEQSVGHMKDLKPRPSLVELYRDYRNSRFQKHFTWNDQLIHLRTTDNWE
ncbi:hypothetical protein PV327_006405 [Microctonus hyperodae]|uniref:Ribosomal protein 63, mitochondrial n=1 Tax=Microctonus hyperodae TaxID=165561 RepID=A0AA39F4A7_MICHY|nr:hypothetical protein PV327_006405 [Microctonus hyperodae]